MLHRNCFCTDLRGHARHFAKPDVMLDAAKLLRDERDIRIVIFGDGALLNTRMLRAEQISNVLFPLYPAGVLFGVSLRGDGSSCHSRKALRASCVPARPGPRSSWRCHRLRGRGQRVGALSIEHWRATAFA